MSLFLQGSWSWFPTPLPAPPQPHWLGMARLPQPLLGAEQKKLDGWYNKTTKDYWLRFAFQRLRSSFKCLGLHLSPRYRPVQASTFMVQDIAVFILHCCEVSNPQLFNDNSVGASRKEEQQVRVELWQAPATACSAFPALGTLSHGRCAAARLAREG